MITGELIGAAARLNFADTPGENFVQQRFGIPSADFDRQFTGVTKDNIGAHGPIHFIICGGV